jgi:ferric-dicitrate binding protein FerR (iron transport regulator)
MKDFKKYTLEDFVQDLYFRKWVLGKLPKEDTFWESWIEENPSKHSILEEAKTLVIATQIEEIDDFEYAKTTGIQAILDQTNKKKKWINLKLSTAIAASILLVLFTIWWTKSYNLPLINETLKRQETENKSPKSLFITLSDGTKVTLKKDSKIQVSKDFGNQKRVVYLTGEAFFEVNKDPLNPFLVYAGGIVTKVLGTSFTIRAYQNESKTSVAVKTGHVTVYQEKSIKQNNHPDQILLTPNQEAVFEKTVNKIVKTVVSKPIFLVNTAEIPNFEYNETSIVKVFDQLQTAFGVKIVHDAELLANCNLTASLSEESLFEKIDIICETIQAKYEIADGQIVIYAKGCK